MIDNEIKKFNSGDWANATIVCEYLNITFCEGFKLFEFSRTTEWWSLCGKTIEERARHGQKVTQYFRKKREKL